MISWSIRYSYGRGAARVAIAAPIAPLVMVSRRSSQEILASLSPLVLALLLSAAVALLASVIPPVAQLRNHVTVVFERTPPLAPPESIREAVEQPPQIARELPAAAPEPRPIENLEAPALPAASESIIAFEMDGLGSAPKLPEQRASTSSPKLVKIQRTTSNARATDIAPIAVASAPLDIARIETATTSLPGLPAVSLAGPTSATALDGVAAETADSFEAGLAAFPSTAAVAPLPGPVGSSFRELNFEAAAAGRSPSGNESSALEGVPLETLAACSTREREDDLKQRLMRSIESGGECAGHDGTYRFLEAKNLNAFLMRVARNTRRELGDRCDELMRAQMCVDAQRVGGRKQ